MDHFEDPSDSIEPAAPWLASRELLITKPTIRLARSAYDRAMAHLGWRGREEGGLLLGPRHDHAVTAFIADEAGCGTPGSFTLGADWLNETLRWYVAMGMDCKGIIHSHPPGCTGLSGPDLDYARRLMGNPRNGVDRLLMPLVVDHRIVPFVIFPSMPHVAHEADIELF